MRLIFIAAAAIVFTTISFGASAADQSMDLLTPRGSLVKIDVYNRGQPWVLLLAPGQSCGPRLDMYDALGTEARNQGFTLVRLYWAYCLTTPQGRPSDDLSIESEDFLTALSYVKKELGIADTNIFVGGKSLGTFVSFEVFKSQKSLSGLVMLTPVCTDSTDAMNRKNVFAEYYPELSTETRTVVLAQGNADILCDANHFQEFLKDKPNNFVSLVTKGDHGFGIKNPAGQYDVDLGAKNLQAISKWIFTWLK